MAISILIDWISITDHEKEDRTFSSHPCLNDGKWSDTSARLGYTIGGKHILGIVEYMNYSRKIMGCHVIYSGKALQKMKSKKNISATDVLVYHINEGHNIARLDLAIDFKDCGSKVSDYVFAFRGGEAKTKLRKATIVKSLTGGGATLYIGSMKKRKNLVRIYDKGAEVGTGDDWVRVELQIMGKKATSTGKTIAQSENIKETIIGIIKGVVDFPTVTAWWNLTNNLQEIEMSSEEKTQGDTEKWLMKQVVPALSRVIVVDFDFWVQFKLALNFECHKNAPDDDIPFDYM